MVALEVLIAEEQLSLSMAALCPNLKKEPRKKYFDGLNKKLKLVEKDKSLETITTQEMAMKLANSMIGK